MFLLMSNQQCHSNKGKIRMWANAQRDDRPAEYRWHPLFNTAKFGWHSLLECRAVMLPNTKLIEICWGAPNSANRSQPLVGRSSPYCGDMWRRYCCLTIFFRLSIRTLVAKIYPNKVTRWCPDGEFLGSCISDLHSKFALGPHHV